MEMQDAVERRAHMRWSPPRRDLTIGLRVGGALQRCRLKDISAGGAALIADSPVEVDTEVVVELNHALCLPGLVYRARSDAIVVKFSLPTAVVRQIDQGIQLGLAPAEW